MTGPRSNRLISALPEATYQEWLPDLEAIDMPVGDVLCDSGCAPSHVYFPTTSIVALLHILECGASLAVAVVGSEGIVGVSAFMGGHSTPSLAVVQTAGRGFRMLATRVSQAFEQGGAVTKLLLRYTQALMTQIAQSAPCNRHHDLDQRLCCFLLSSLDRLPAHELRMTQDLIAKMLGVRREGITEAALNLRAAGLIQYARGHISVLDRPGLERRTCECYALVKNEYDRLLPDLTAR